MIYFYPYMKQLAILIFTLIATFVVVTPSYAAGSSNGTTTTVSCQPIYGGGTSCTNGSLGINKTVQHPQTGAYIDNLGVNDAKYAPTNTVNFQITIINNTNGVLTGIIVKDTLPQYMSLRSGAGAYDATHNTLTFGTEDLQPGASRTFTITGAITDAANLPQNQAITCITNTAVVTSHQMTNTDTASFCIQNTVTPTVSTGITPSVTKGGIITQPGVPTTTSGGLPVYPAPSAKGTPATGPEMIYLLAAIPTGLFGQFLRKKAATK